MRMTFLLSDFLTTRLDVRHVVPTSQSFAERSIVIRFVTAQVLPASRPRLRPGHGQAVQGWHRQFEVMPVGRTDHQSQHDATCIGEYRAFDAEFASIGGVFPGFFPLPAVLCSSPCRGFANAKQYPAAGRTRSVLASTTCGTRHAPSNPESNGVGCSPNPPPAEQLSKGNPSATQNRCRRLHDARRAVAAHPADCVPGGDQFTQTSPNGLRHPPIRNSGFHGLVLL